MWPIDATNSRTTDRGGVADPEKRLDWLEPKIINNGLAQHFTP